MTESKPSQRERLVEAIIVTAARYGYREANVARVIAQAGVSRATFYECFEGKEECFLVAYREIAQRIAGHIQLLDAERGEVVGPGEILERLLESADREPAAARVFLLESLAAGPAVRAEHEEFLGVMEERLDAFLDSAPKGRPRLEIPARALLGGIGNVVAIRVFRGEAGRLADLRGDLETWLRSYTTSAPRLRQEGWTGLGSGICDPVEPEPSPLDDHLPRGRSSLPHALVASEQRQRVLAGVARVGAKKGYAAMSVADIVSAAGVAREVFYAQFRSKEDAFLSAQAYALEMSVSRSAGSFFSEQPWPSRVWNGIQALLEYFASVPDLANLDIVESYAAGNAAIRRSFEARMAFTLFLEDGYRQRPEAERLPRLCSETIAGAILEPMRHLTVEGQAGQAQVLAPQIFYVATAPFIGPQKALEQIKAKCATARARKRSARFRGHPAGD
jgi:AcrR family transcriptional regulator